MFSNVYLTGNHFKVLKPITHYNAEKGSKCENFRVFWGKQFGNICKKRKITLPLGKQSYPGNLSYRDRSSQYKNICSKMGASALLIMSKSGK